MEAGTAIAQARSRAQNTAVTAGAIAGQDEAGAVNRTIGKGIYCAIAAPALTMATAVLAFAFPGGPKNVDVTVVLTPTGQGTVPVVCALMARKTEITGKVEETQLGKSVTPLELSESDCRAPEAAGRTITLLLRTPDVGAVIRSG